MNIFEITIQRQTKNGWPAVVKYTKDSEFLPIRRQGILKLNNDDNFAQLTALLGQPKKYGAMLGKALFYDDVRDAFVSALANLKNNQDSQKLEHLHVLLYVEAEDLKELRWEKLCAPLDGEWDFLALNQQIPFSLYIPASTERLFPAIGRRDLQALIIAASPEGLGRFQLAPFDVQATISSVKTALGDIPCDVLAMVDGAIGPPTFDALMKSLTDNEKYYTLLHMVCHGKLLADGETVIYLSNSQNQVEPVTATTLIDRLTNVRRAPHFAFLSTCSSASTSAEAEGGKGGLAQRLVRELGMPAVVAMTEPVTINTAQALAETFYLQLKTHGSVDLALVQANAGLQGRYDVTVPALFSRLGGRPLFSDTPDRPLTDKEVNYGLERLQQLLPERAPILCQELTNQVTVLQQTLGTQTNVSNDERQKALVVMSQLSTKVLDLDFKALALGKELPAYDARCPFRGLYPFRSEDSEFFCGREALIEQLRQKLAEYNFLPVLGASGSGKSSVVMAGLIPLLQKKEPQLVMAYMTPRSDPLAQLEASLLKVENQPYVLVVDQFEELFTLCLHEKWRQNFIHQLLKLAAKQRVIITMRADFWGECAPYPELRDLMEQQQKLIAPMTQEELHSAIEIQVAKVGLRFEVDLLNKILDDVEGEPGAMPLLQHALLELWQRRHGRWLLSEEYRAIGGVQLAIANTADEFYNQSDAQEKELIKNIFLRLTHLDVDAVQGEKVRDTRQRVDMDNLTPVDGDETLSKNLINELANKRLVITSINEATKKQEVEVAHEALIRHWQKLNEWLLQDRKTLIAHQNISSTAEDWEKYNFDESYLVHQGGRLEEAEQLRQQSQLKLNKLENDYLNACIDRRERIRNQEEEQRQRELKYQKKAHNARLTMLIAAPLVTGLVVLIIGPINSMETQKKDIRNLNESSQVLLESNQGFDALIDSLEAARKLRNLILPQPDLEQKIQETLQKTLLEKFKERNRIQKDTKKITNEIFSPDSKIFATVSKNGTVTLRNFKGDKLVSLPHPDGVTNVIFSHNSQLIATVSQNKTVTVWNIQGKLLSTIRHERQPSKVLFSRDAQIIATISDSKTIKLWDTHGKLLKTLPHENVSDLSFSSVPVASLEGIVSYSSKNKSIIIWNQNSTKNIAFDNVLEVIFSPDGQKFATAHPDKTIKIWNMDGKLSKTLSAGEDLMKFKSFSPVSAASPKGIGQILVSKHQDNVVKLWNIDSAQVKSLSHESPIKIVAFSPDTQRIVTVDKNFSIKIWTRDGTLITTFSEHQSTVNSVSFSHDSQRIATASNDKTVKILSRDGQELKTLQHDYAVKQVRFSADDNTIASVTRYNTTHIWNGDKLKFSTLTGYKKPLYFVTLSPDSKTIATIGTTTDEDSVRESSVRLSNIEGKNIVTLKGHKDVISSLSLSPNGKLIATASLDKTVKIWDTQGKEQQTLIGHKDTVTRVIFSPNGKLIATGSADNTVKIWDIQGKELHTFTGHKDTITSISFSPDSQLIVTGSTDNTAKLWNILEGKELKILMQHNDEVINVAFSVDGNTIMTASRDGVLQHWDSNANLLRRKQFDGVFESVSFSPDGKIIASTDGDNNVQVWSSSGELLENLYGHNDKTTSMNFSSDGKLLATASYDESVIVWNLDSNRWKLLDENLDALIKDACQLVTGYQKNISQQEREKLPCDNM
jgi:WD40 repeat protein